MFKDYNKYLSTSLKVYIFVLVIVFIMKIVGLDYFGLDVNNINLINLDIFLKKTKLIYIVDFITLYIMFYVYICIVCDKKNTKILTLIATLVEIILQFVLLKFNKVNELKYIVDFSIMLIFPIFINKKIKIKKPIIMLLLITLYQLISYSIRGQAVTSNFDCKIVDILLNIDEYIMLIITYKIYFEKGVVNLCHQEVGYSLLKKIHLKKSLAKLPKSLRKFKKLSKEEKLSISIYIFLSLIWNIFTIIFVLIIAKLNNTFIECLFIITSFWLSKHSFGKPFHLSSMIQCFVVSNVSYYILNRITTPLGISILVPIMLGVGLSYITSKFVKKTYKPLYKGMPKELFEETILKVTDKNNQKYKICYDFYIKGKSDLSLSFEYNYSVAGIRKIKNRINDKIKELN